MNNVDNDVESDSDPEFTDFAFRSQFFQQLVKQSQKIKTEEDGAKEFTALPARIIPELSDSDPPIATGLRVGCATAAPATTLRTGERKVTFRALSGDGVSTGDDQHTDPKIETIF